MAVDDLSRRILYTGDGSSTEFAFNFVVFVPTDVNVYTQDEDGEDKLISPSNYTVTLNENQDTNPGGVVQFNTAPADEEIIAVVSGIPETQPMVLTTYDGFDPEVLNKSADRAVSLIQQLSDDVERAIKLPKTSQKTTAEAYNELASAADRANEALSLMDETLAAATEVMDALSEAGDVTGATQVVATGATEARSIASKLADVMTIDDFGATADGVTDDASAITHAIASGCGTLDLKGKTVATTKWPDGIELVNGYLNYRGQYFNVDGGKLGKGEAYGVKKLADLNLFSGGTYAFTRAGWAAQGVTYLKHNDGTEHVYMSHRSYGLANGKDRQMGSITDFVLGEDGDTISHVASVPFLPLGHSQGLGSRMDSNGYIYLYANEAGIPDRYLAGGTNYGKGFTRVRWRGNSTTAADVVNYRLMPLVKSSSDTSLDNRLAGRMLTPTVTPDGKRIILIGGSRVWIYDLEAVEACATADAGWSWSDAGEGSPSSDTETQYTAQWALPATFIDATSVKPLASFPLDTSTARTLQACASDGTFIYVVAGDQTPGATACVEVYDFSGKLVRYLPFNGARHFYSANELEGKTSLGVLSKCEAEGIFVRGDQLVSLFIVRWYGLGDIVSYNGRNYAAAANSTGVAPDTFADASWIPTTLAATAGSWNATTAYAPGARTIDATTEKRLLIALEPEDRSDANQVARFENSLLNSYWSYQDNKAARLLKGKEFRWGFENPYLGTTEDRMKLDWSGLWLHELADGSRRYIDGGSAECQVFWRFYSDTDPTLPGMLTARTDSGVILGITPGGFRVGGTQTGVPGLKVAYGSTNESIFGVRGSSSSLFLEGIGHNVILSRTTLSGSTYTFQAGAGLYAGSFSPFYGAVTALSLGSATARWSEVFATTGSINTSDERKKQDIADPDEALMRAWGKVGFKVFRFRDAVAKKGNAARLHVGVIAQQVREAFASEGLDANDYGLFCYDRWDAKAAEIDPKTGEVVEPAVEAGDAYGIRYEEALALECAYQRWRLAQLEEKLG